MSYVYPYPNIVEFDAETLLKEISDVGLSEPSLGHSSGTKILNLHFEDILSEAEHTALNSVITAHHPALSVLKHTRYGQIDVRTRDLIDVGISFNGEMFSFSLEAQTNWMGIFQAANAGFIAFPRAVSSQTGSYTFETAADYTNFYLTGMALMESHVGSGRVLKEQITAAVDIPAVDAILDER